jgi:hypothetical protein
MSVDSRSNSEGLRAVSRIWRYAAQREQCGYHWSCVIKSGDLYCLLSGEGWITAKTRCKAHAGSEPPEDMDTAPRPEPLRVPEFSSVKHLAEAAERDVKMAQAGERDDE